jgi:hypothetical protein
MIGKEGGRGRATRYVDALVVSVSLSLHFVMSLACVCWAIEEPYERSSGDDLAGLCLCPFHLYRPFIAEKESVLSRIGDFCGVFSCWTGLDCGIAKITTSAHSSIVVFSSRFLIWKCFDTLSSALSLVQSNACWSELTQLYSRSLATITLQAQARLRTTTAAVAADLLHTKACMCKYRARAAILERTDLTLLAG